VEAPVSLLDIVPTLMALSKNRRADSAWQGISLVDHLQVAAGPQRTQAASSEDTRELFAEVSFVQPPNWPAVNESEKAAFMTSVQIGSAKLIHDLETGQWEFYDLAQDPDERTNLLGSSRPEPARMQKTLQAWQKGRVERWGIKLDAAEVPSLEDIRRIRALGYLD
jgi:arylsulfatase A-like enzyme